MELALLNGRRDYSWSVSIHSASVICVLNMNSISFVWSVEVTVMTEAGRILFSEFGVIPATSLALDP
jgi:hypothetical protein